MSSGNVLTDRQTDRQTDRIPYRYFYERITGTGKYQIKETIPRVDEAAKAHSTRGGWDNKYRKVRGIGEYAKRENVKKTRWEQSAFGNNVGNVDERQEESNKGEYP